MEPGHNSLQSRVQGLGRGALNVRKLTGFRAYSTSQVDRIWLLVYYNKIPIYPILYLLKGDCIVWEVGFRARSGFSKP